MAISRFSALVLCVVTGLVGELRAQFPVPWTGQQQEANYPFTGVPFPLPQERDATTGRRRDMCANAMTVSWDGKLIMFQMGVWQWSPGVPSAWWVDLGAPPTGSNAWDLGYCFTTFDKAMAKVGAQGEPVFDACFGPVLHRFRHLPTAGATQTVSQGVPGYPGTQTALGLSLPFPDGYPDYHGTMGELGLTDTFDTLSNNMYPAPQSVWLQGAVGNPFPSDAKGVPKVGGVHHTYDAYVTFQDQPKFWNGAAWVNMTGGTGQSYEPGTYPNGAQLAQTGGGIKRNGVARLRITVEDLSGSGSTNSAKITQVEVVEKWRPFLCVGDGRSTPVNPVGLTAGVSVPFEPNRMWVDTFEPALTNDGHLMIGKGIRRVVATDETSNITFNAHVVFFYNDVAFAADGWVGPFYLQEMHQMQKVTVGGRTLAERYPLARKPLKAYDGSLYGDSNGDGIYSSHLWPSGSTFYAQATCDAPIGFEGGYCWIDPDGRFVIYSTSSGGVGKGHPQLPDPSVDDGGGTSNRAQASIVGSVTNWQQWRIDHAAENPSRHCFTAWDNDSRTLHIRTASFGMSPGFWDMLRGAEGVPMHRNGAQKLHLVNSQRLLYYELDLSPAAERDFGFYLPMTEMMRIKPGTFARREIDLGRTPDLSGNGNCATLSGSGAGRKPKLPCEYFELPSEISADTFQNITTVTPQFRGLPVPGLYLEASQPTNIEPNWSASDVVTSTSGPGVWARLADGPAGVPIAAGGFTVPFAGRGAKHDMDSDTVWGRVGQAMFFPPQTWLSVPAPKSRVELHPGSGLTAASTEFTASFWICPLVAVTATTLIYDHAFDISLLPGGGVTMAMPGMPSLSGGATPIGVWTHVAVTCRGIASGACTATLFVDGAVVQTVTAACTGIGNAPDPIRIGCLGGTSANDAVFLLDEVALKNSALTPEDVAAMALVPASKPSFANATLPFQPNGFDNPRDGRVPTSNPYDATIANIGADLFFDQQLSSGKHVSCATCHDPALAFTDGKVKSTGQGGLQLRNSPTLLNRCYSTAQFFDARAVDLEDQVLRPIFNQGEMGNNANALTNYILTSAYAARFTSKSLPLNENGVRLALATYVRALSNGGSSFDTYQATGTGLTAAEERGMALFLGKAHCSACHHGANFTDELLWNTGTGIGTGANPDFGASGPEAGLGTRGRARYRFAFKTPTLRSLVSTGPFFHDGSAATIADVINFYDRGGLRVGGTFGSADHLAVTEEVSRPLGLTFGEKLDLEAFLLALGGVQHVAANGTNHAPVVTVTLSNSGGGLSVVVTVTDVDGTGEIVTTSPLQDSLQVQQSGLTYDWSSGTVAPVAQGYQATLQLAGTVAAHPVIQIQAADCHGKKSPISVH